MVVSVEPHATRAGVEVLESGGNAADAAIAVAYALSVTHPSAGNIGGGGLAVIHRPGAPAVAVDFRERAPRAVTQERFDRMIDNKAVGPAAVGVPGTVAGLELIRKRFGTLSRRRLMKAAIALARDGHPVGRRQAKTIAWAWPVLRHDPSARAIFGSGIRPLSRGSLLVQKDLARTLERIATEGERGFYEGATGAALSAALSSGDGMIDQTDLSAYRAVIRDPIAFRYRGLDVRVAPPPSAGGIALAQMLLWREHVRAFEHPWLGADGIHWFSEIARRAHATRRFSVVDPDTQGAGATKVVTLLDIERVIATYPPIDPRQATPSAKVHPLYDAAVRELEHTTHVSVVDESGMAVSLTTTLSAGFGARFVAKGTGVVMNNALAAFGTAGADVPAPGRRMTTSMCPALVLSDGATVAVLGSPGGDTIPNTVARLVIGLVDEGLPLAEVVDAPRVHHGFVPDEVRFEGARPVPKDVIDTLRTRGHTISKKRIPIGDANVIVIDEAGAHGYADPREGGLALGPKATLPLPNAEAEVTRKRETPPRSGP